MNQELRSKLLGSTRVSVGGVALLDRKAVEVFFGGTKPLHPATVYRHIAAGRIPPPIKISAGCSRWSLEACEAALARMVGGHNV
jgi:predicted DNA-binding transcriptional regulator AlpA